MDHCLSISSHTTRATDIVKVFNKTILSFLVKCLSDENEASADGSPVVDDDDTSTPSPVSLLARLAI